MFFCLLLCVVGTVWAQSENRNVPKIVVFNNLTYTPQEKKANVGNVLGAIVDVLAGQVTQEHGNYIDALRASLVKGISQSRRISLTDGAGTLQPDWYIDGTVSNISSTSKTEELKDSKGKTYKQNYYKALVGVTLHVKDAQTGLIVASPTFNVSAEDLSWIETREGAMASAFDRMAAKVMRYFNKQLPLLANIVEGARDKKDKQKEVYIDLGEATKGVMKGLHFGVYTSKVVAGKEARKQVGRIKIVETQGDELSLCKVLSGGKEIKAAIDAGDNIAVVSLDR